MQDLIIRGKTLYYDSRAIAKMVEKRHNHLLRDIENYISVISENPILGFQKISDFFVPSSYKARGNNKIYPCYLITKMGCEVIANKMTGDKGIIFTVKYVQRFNEMERLQLEKSTPAGQEARTKNKIDSKAFNEAVKLLADYAAANGSHNAARYYTNMNKLINSVAEIYNRDNAGIKGMEASAAAMKICTVCIHDCIRKGMYYKDIYRECKHRLDTMKAWGGLLTV